MPSKAKSKKIDFEAALEQLEALVARLEAGEISLEESLRAFEEGVKLTKECQVQLTEAEQRVKMLVQEQGELVSVDFYEDDEAAGDDED